MMMDEYGTLLEGKNQGSWRKACPSFTLSTTNPTWKALGMNLHVKLLEL
jgi:hypothetical protein